jgi:hypothetical protein
MRKICSTTLRGKPITPPQLTCHPGAPHRAEDLFSVHIVEIVDPKGGGCVQQMFKNTNLYFVAFRPLPRGEDVNNTRPWFKFQDKKIPLFFHQ